MFFDPGLGYVPQGWPSVLVRAGAVGVYVTAAASVALAFLCLPRWRWGSRMLFWCFLLMGLSLLTRVTLAYWGRALPWEIQINSRVFPFIFAMPPFILAAIIRHPVIETEIQRTS